jgi:hypothetical protein
MSVRSCSASMVTRTTIPAHQQAMATTEQQQQQQLSSVALCRGEISVCRHVTIQVAAARLSSQQQLFRLVAGCGPDQLRHGRVAALGQIQQQQCTPWVCCLPSQQKAWHGTRHCYPVRQLSHFCPKFAKCTASLSHSAAKACQSKYLPLVSMLLACMHA